VEETRLLTVFVNMQSLLVMAFVATVRSRLQALTPRHRTAKARKSMVVAVAIIAADPPVMIDRLVMLEKAVQIVAVLAVAGLLKLTARSSWKDRSSLISLL
jgi:hypothetical protein